MRRLGAVLIVLPLAACGALRDMFTAHPADAATAAGQALSADQLATWASQVKGMPLQADNLSRMAGMWVDYSLFASALAHDRSLQDSATVAAAMWPMVSQFKWDHFRQRLVAGRSNLTPAEVDSAYDAGQLRAFQHILLGVPANADPATVAATRTRLEGVRRQLEATHGANFGALAQRYSQDPSKTDGGFLGVWPRGHFMAPFEEPAWKLGPGEMSGVIQTPYGFHIIRRPPLAEVRDSFMVGVQQGIDEAFDSTYIAHLRQLRHLKLAEGATATTRSALQDADAAERNGATLVRYDGGAFRVRDLVRWLRALDPQLTSSVPGATDQQLTKILETLATRDILLQQSDSAHAGLTPDDWRAVTETYDSSLADLEAAIQLTPALLKDSAATPAARVAFAAARVNQYLDELVTRRRGFYAVPPFLASVLRENGRWHVDPAGVQRATEQAQADRTAMGGGPSGPGTGGQPLLRPAPGPAPAPGAAVPPGATPPARGSRPSQPHGGR